MYDYAEHIAWDLLSLIAKPMQSDNTYRVKKALKESGAMEGDVKVALKIVELLNKNWMEVD